LQLWNLCNRKLGVMRFTEKCCINVVITQGSVLQLGKTLVSIPILLLHVNVDDVKIEGELLASYHLEHKKYS
jgi:hypothetical protein